MENNSPQSYKGHEEIQNKYQILVIGIGNAYRSDDAAGLYVAHRLEKQAFGCVNVIEQSGDGAVLIESWKDTDIVILIDAVYSGAKPGTIHRFDANTQTIPSEFFHYSTHAFGVAEAIELARVLRQLPSQLIVYGIEGKCFEVGVEVSSEVEEAAIEAEKRIRRDIYHILCDGSRARGK